MQTLEYRTRDGKGNDITRIVPIKEFPLHDFDPPQACAVCGKVVSSGCLLGECVSSEFCDWSWFDTDCICLSCSRYFTLYKFSYIVNGEDIHLYNVREMAQQLKQPQRPPFLAVITTNQKKHYFFKSRWNLTSLPEMINLDDLTIETTPKEMTDLFGWVEAMLSLGAAKGGLEEGQIPTSVLLKTGAGPLMWLRRQLRGKRAIKIPIYLAQRTEMPETEALEKIKSVMEEYNV